MTLRHFLDAAHAVLVDDHRRQGAGLMQALDSNVMWRAGGPPEEVPLGASAADVSPALESQIERENTLALSELNKMLGGVAGFGGAR